MSKYETYKVEGIIKALTPIAHSEVLDEDKSIYQENKTTTPSPFRRLPFLLKNEDGKPELKGVYAITGNSIRGIGRRLLFYHLFEDLYDMDMDEFFDNNVVNSEGKPLSDKDKRNIMSIFLNGGVSPAGAKKSGSVPAGVYEKVMTDIPMLGLLGAVFMSYHFDGACSIGNAMFRCKEMADVYKDIWNDDPEQLISLKDYSGDKEKMRYLDVRHTKSQNGKDDAEFPTSLADTKNDENKLQMIYGIEMMPAGSEYYWRSFCNTDNEHIKIAFYGMIGLLVKHGILGGQNGKGYGRVEFNLKDFDVDKAIKEFDEDAMAHKDECLEGIKLLAKEFRYKIEKDKTDTTKKGKK